MAHQLIKTSSTKPASDAVAASLKDSLGFNPSNLNIALSSSKSGLGVVNNFSPEKIEFAPAIKHNACSATVISLRPALNLTIAFGIIILAVAIILIISQISTFAFPSNGVPSTLTNALIGTLPGCAGNVDNVCNMPILSL